ncbi:TRAP transporter small permease [Salipiger abyssi]|uniref:TRAP transporter small permease protein n=1 Tax=Salipiger abyssi TaxID=1250539 RepID=A0A1P8UN07_9RHOB|nr:TRAP transporter small permease [Salipiger abyssi]APZ50799.1 TRAP-type C4-dicarboxylate transport system, small permease component [Salipiger abyssi]
MSGLDRAAGRLGNALSWLAYAALILMAVQVSASVASRWLFGQDIPVTTELATYYYMVALTYLPLALVDRRHGHLFAEFFYVLMPTRVQRLMDVLNAALALGFLGFLGWRTALGAIDRTRSGDVISTTIGLFPVWPAQWIVPVGLGAAGLAVAVRLAEAFRALPHDPHQEGDRR